MSAKVKIDLDIFDYGYGKRGSFTVQQIREMQSEQGLLAYFHRKYGDDHAITQVEMATKNVFGIANSFTVEFESPADAMLFKLTHGGAA